ncbi:hypothetical protein IC744_05455 [Microbacterium hominis]|uniref:hypothetical protein n=1 Tax=Microbacterium TaxID=33882 RepID=UPI00168A9F04|nr:MULTISPECIES: hypothetical protein [Microbacterium]QOC25807.1 hypothetical protein IC745_16110 [Microbacterium hominis]QOC29793.1 hypothetical protein IC744_05455 [Microbacterium hominis]QYF97819.1 hypothetical protein KY498_00705 [Microbacterium sp. PAMC21962]
MSTQSTTKSPSDSAALGLGSVLAGSLPSALMTADAPARYTVEAVFTRRPQREEIADLLSDETREMLIRNGYPVVELTVSDRRLEIANTNLEELRDGLGTVLADRLAEISDRAVERRDAAALRDEKTAEGERERAAAVVALAASVSFERAVTAAG